MEQMGLQIKEAEQFLELPRAIATKEGIPYKGQKSSITKFYEKKYEEAFLEEFPSGWVPHSVILEGCSSLMQRQSKCMEECRNMCYISLKDF